MARTDPQTNLRLPRELKDWLVKRAAEHRRSLAGEVVVRLEESREAESKAQKGEPRSDLTCSGVL
ncbi:Arc-like DNA binding domain protein [compost metagenome]